MKESYTFGNAEVTHDVQTQITSIIYKGFTKSEDLRAAKQKSLEIMKQYKSYKLLVDHRKMEEMKEEDRQWIAKSYYPIAQKSLIHPIVIALVMPNANNGKLPNRNEASELYKTLYPTHKQHKAEYTDTQHFSNPQSAKCWLITSK